VGVGDLHVLGFGVNDLRAWIPSAPACGPWAPVKGYG